MIRARGAICGLFLFVAVLLVAQSALAEPSATFPKNRAWRIAAETPTGIGYLSLIEDRLVFLNVTPRKPEETKAPADTLPEVYHFWDPEVTETGVAFRLVDDRRGAIGYLTFDPDHPEKGVYLSKERLAGSIWTINTDDIRNTALSMGDYHLGIGPDAKSYLYQGERFRSNVEPFRAVMHEYPFVTSREPNAKFQLLGFERVLSNTANTIRYRQFGGFLGMIDGRVALIHVNRTQKTNLENLPENTDRFVLVWVVSSASGGVVLRCDGKYLAFDPAGPGDGLHFVEDAEEATIWRGTLEGYLCTRVGGKKWGFTQGDGIERFFNPKRGVLTVRPMTITDDSKVWLGFDREKFEPN